MAEYMNCGTDDERSDFFAFNDYSWCDPSSYQISGWDQKVKNFTGYGLPLFLSEYGCNTNTRQFQEVAALYDTKMTGVYSGGLVYEYSEEGSKYGLVQINGNDVSTNKDYDALKTALNKTPNPSGDGNYNKTGGSNPCPKKNSPNWDVDATDSLPAIPVPAEKYLKDGAGQGIGFSGKGSQTAGTPSSSTASPGSGSGSSSSSSGTAGATSKGAAAGLVKPFTISMAPIAVSLVTIVSSLFGASFILL
jgi:hypothetical protein